MAIRITFKHVTGIFLVLSTLGFLLQGCNKNGVAPPSELEPGRRDYEWTLDTLAFEMNIVQSIWGVSPSDVWAVGPGGTYKNRLWHFDGTEWTNYAVRNNNPIYGTGEVLYGVAADDVWMGGGAGWLSQGAALWHYDGGDWQEHTLYDIEGTSSVAIHSLYGLSPTELYASGSALYSEGGEEIYRGFILRYDGTQWTEVFRASWESQFPVIRQDGHRLFVYSYEYDSTHALRTVFYELKQNALHVLQTVPNGGGVMRQIGEVVYFRIGETMYQFRRGKFRKQFTLPRRDQFFGRHPHDIFIQLEYGLGHYNGTDLQPLYTFPDSLHPRIKPYMLDAVLFDTEVFIAVWDGYSGENMVLHGVVPEEAM